MKVRELLSELDHEVWARVEPKTRKTGIMVFSADWHCNAYLPKGLDKYLDWEIGDLYVEIGDDPETGDQVAILAIPATRLENEHETESSDEEVDRVLVDRIMGIGLLSPRKMFNKKNPRKPRMEKHENQERKQEMAQQAHRTGSRNQPRR